MATPKNGFTPYSQNGGPITGLTRQYALATANAFFIGDAVDIKADGFLHQVSGVGDRVAGVIVDLYGLDANGYRRELTFNQPGGGVYIASGAGGYADILVDENAVFIAALDVTASTGLIGQSVNVSSGTPNTTIGRSGQSLAVPATSVQAHFQIVGISPFEKVSRKDDIANPAGVLVRIAQARFGPAGAAI